MGDEKPSDTQPLLHNQAQIDAGHAGAGTRLDRLRGGAIRRARVISRRGHLAREHEGMDERSRGDEIRQLVDISTVVANVMGL
jgi:hypothetical protein